MVMAMKVERQTIYHYDYEDDSHMDECMLAIAGWGWSKGYYIFVKFRSRPTYWRSLGKNIGRWTTLQRVATTD